MPLDNARFAKPRSRRASGGRRRRGAPLAVVAIDLAFTNGGSSPASATGVRSTLHRARIPVRRRAPATRIFPRLTACETAAPIETFLRKVRTPGALLAGWLRAARRSTWPWIAKRSRDDARRAAAQPPERHGRRRIQRQAVDRHLNSGRTLMRMDATDIDGSNRSHRGVAREAGHRDAVYAARRHRRHAADALNPDYIIMLRDIDDGSIRCAPIR